MATKKTTTQKTETTITTTNEFKNTHMSEVCKKLEELYKQLNLYYFDSELPHCIITVQADTTKGALGWCTSEAVWNEVQGNQKCKYHEINICAEHLNSSPENVGEVLLHEMCHLLNSIHGIKDFSRGGTYHNKAFKACAESHHLIVTQDEKYGYAFTKLDDDAKEYITTFLEQIHIFRDPNIKIPKTKKESSTRKYICPFCSISVRATKDVRIICADCQCLMEVEV